MDSDECREKTLLVYSLLRSPIADRNDEWKMTLYSALDDAQFYTSDNLITRTKSGHTLRGLLTSQLVDQNSQSRLIRRVSIREIAYQLLLSGHGIIIDPNSSEGSIILRYGDIWYLAREGDFTNLMQAEKKREAALQCLEDPERTYQPKIIRGTKITEDFFPEYARRAIRIYMETVFGITKPAFCPLQISFEGFSVDAFTFNLRPIEFTTDENYQKAMQALTWFLPPDSIIYVEDFDQYINF